MTPQSKIPEPVHIGGGNYVLDVSGMGVKPSDIARTAMLQEVFNLDEGPVTLTFPASLSEPSYQDLADHLEIFLRKAKRRAEEIRRHKEMTGDVDD